MDTLEHLQTNMIQNLCLKTFEHLDTYFGLLTKLTILTPGDCLIKQALQSCELCIFASFGTHTKIK